MKYIVTFYDKYSDEVRSLTVEAKNEDQAEQNACDRANDLGWDNGFRVLDIEEV